MRIALPTDSFYDYLVALLNRYGAELPEQAKKLVLASFNDPTNASTRSTIIKPLLVALLGPGISAEDTILFHKADGSVIDLKALVQCEEGWINPRLLHCDTVLKDTMQMTVASFWIFESLATMPDLAEAKEAVRNWKEKILHELLGQLIKSNMKNGSGLKIVLPLVDELLKADRECPSYGEVQRTDSKRYCSRSDIVNWIYDIVMEPASNAPTLYTDKVKMKFKAALAFLIQLDKEEVETLMIEPMLNRHSDL